MQVTRPMPLLTAYIDAAMHHAHYELLADDEGFYGEIADLPGVWAQAQTLEACREELQSVLEGWLLLGLRLLRLPTSGHRCDGGSMIQP